MAIIGTLPNNIQNGQSVDANPVMADFNFIVNQVNANANPIGTLTAPSGTRTLFHQAAAPLGWTQDTTITDHTVQVIGTAGGATTFLNGYSSMFQLQWTSDGHALTIAELAVHAHTDSGHTHTDSGHAHSESANIYRNFGTSPVTAGGTINLGQNPQNTGTSFANIQTSFASIQNTGSGSAHTHTKTFNVSSVQMIMCVKT